MSYLDYNDIQQTFIMKNEKCYIYSTNRIDLIDYNNQMDGLASFLVHFIMAISAYPFKVKDPNWKNILGGYGCSV